MNGLQNFLIQGKFSNESTTEQKRLDYIRRSDPIQYFCLEFIEEDFNNIIEKETVYDYYVRLCHKLSHKPTSSNWFSQSFRRYVTYAEDTSFRNSEGKKVRGWKGIKVNLELLNGEFGTIGTIGTIFSKCAKQKILHNGGNNMEIPSQPFQKPENLPKNCKTGDGMIDKLLMSHPEGQYQICFLCNKPILDLNHLTNIEGRLCHVKCKKDLETSRK